MSVLVGGSHYAQHTQPSGDKLGQHFQCSDKQEIRTGAKRVVCSLELLARRVVVPLGSYALEVIRVVLEAAPIV